MNWLRAVAQSPWLPAALVTVVTIGAIGAVVVLTTPAGCNLARHAGVQLTGGKCQTSSAALVFASPSPSIFQPPPQSAPPSTLESPSPPVPSPTLPPLHDPNAPPYEYETASASFSPTYSEASYVGANTPLSCRLPIFAGGPGSGGFLVFPDLTFIGDPRSGVTVPSPSPGGASPPPQGPYGGPAGFYGLTYDQALSRWVPVPRAWVSPDGKRYAYGGQSDGVYVVDIPSNTQTEVGDTSQWFVLGVETEGVYAIHPGQAGLWLLPFAGSPSQITNAGYWSAVGGGAAYGTTTSAVPQGVATLIQRLDLKSRTIQDWFEVANASSYTFGFDAAGHPMFQVQSNLPSPSPAQIWLVTGLGTAEILTVNYNFTGPPVADRHGLWFMAYQATYLLVLGQGMYRVANVGGQLAGGCS
jgi:hypothetical protein